MNCLSASWARAHQQEENSMLLPTANCCHQSQNKLNLQESHSPSLAEKEMAIHEKSTLFLEHSTNFRAS